MASRDVYNLVFDLGTLFQVFVILWDLHNIMSAVS